MSNKSQFLADGWVEDLGDVVDITLKTPRGGTVGMTVTKDVYQDDDKLRSALFVLNMRTSKWRTPLTTEVVRAAYG